MISENLKDLKNSLPDHVTLVAVSKTKSQDEIMQAYNTGHRIFGENKVQEMVTKHETMPEDISWHMIGHLQRNKVKYMAGFVSMIHAVDSLRLLIEIDKQAAKHDRVIDCLLQVKIAEEETKFGMEKQEVEALLKSPEVAELKNVRIKGLMGMATFTDDQDQVRREFAGLKELYIKLKEDFKLNVLSIGMSGDYPIAIEEGSTMVRVGSAIFGARNY